MNVTGAPYRSQMAKATKQMPPMTIMALISADCHLLAWDEANVIGSRTRVNAAVIRIKPIPKIKKKKRVSVDNIYW